jgi:carbamoylphosphate synthase large subunit
LAIRFRDLGTRISFLAPPDHPLDYVQNLGRRYAIRPLDVQGSIKKAIAQSRPDLIVPADDLAVWLLHALAESDPVFGAIISSSLGDPQHFSVVRSRLRLLALAESLEINVPRTIALTSEDDARAAAREWPLPAVVKLDGSNNGAGVEIVESPEAIARTMRRFRQRPPSLVLLKRWSVNGDPTVFVGIEQLPTAEISLQSFVTGAPCNAMFACHKGCVLAGVAVRTVVTQHATGTSLVVDCLHDSQAGASIFAAGEKLASTLGLTGFFGLDFLLDPKSGNPVLLEMNPRATQMGHLMLDQAENEPTTLVAALWLAMTGDARRATKLARTSKARIAFFPQATVLAAEEPALRAAWLDEPTEEPTLLRELQRCPWHHRRWSARVYDTLRRPEPFAPVRWG